MLWGCAGSRCEPAARTAWSADWQSRGPVGDARKINHEPERAMSTRIRIVSAVAFAVLWTAFMLWWTYPDRGVAHTVILTSIGMILGLLWYLLFGRPRRSNG